MTNHHDSQGEARLRNATRRLRQAAATTADKQHKQPLNLAPTTPFEQAILHHYEALRRDYEDLKKRVDWLTISIVGAALTFVLETVFRP